MIITHARRPRRVRVTYDLRRATSASCAACTSISDFASPAHTTCQLEAQVKFFELAIRLVMQTSRSGKAVSKGLSTPDILQGSSQEPEAGGIEFN
jgi:hypothetical protein